MYLTKEQIMDFAMIKNYEAKIKTCANDNITNRRKVNEIIDLMKEFNPNVESNLFKAMSNIYNEYLPK